jgi:poly(3-hydroxybutyrate) depolymerase
VPLASGRTRHPDAEEVLYRWVAFAGCRPNPAVAETRTGAPGTGSAGHAATRYVFSGCRDQIEIALWKLSGAGHGWPGAPAAAGATALGSATDVIDANEEVWRFVRRFTLPATRR